MGRIVLSLLFVLFSSAIASAQSTIYWNRDYIRDANGSVIAVATPQPSDTAAPSEPAGLQVTGTTPTSVNLSWQQSTENGTSGLAGYTIYRNAIPVGVVSGLSFTDLGLTANTTYVYRVAAFDNAFNYSTTNSSASGSTWTTIPTNLVATAASSSQINLTWTTPGIGAPHHYGVWRSSGGGSWSKIGTSTTPSYADATATSNLAYVYKISSEDSGNVLQGWSNTDFATAIVFTDETLVVGSTVIKAVHVTELRTAVNALRTLAGLGTASWTDSSLTNVFAKAAHISELRSNLASAMTTLGFSSPSYTDPTLGGVKVKKIHIDQLRQNIR